MNKKAQGLSINMIILIVLGLIVMGVLIFMLGGKVKMFGTSANSCTDKTGAECVASAGECKGAVLGAFDCKESKGANAVCCLKS